MKYIIDEDDLRILLRAYYQNEAIDLGKTNKDDIYDDFIDYLDNMLDVPYKNFDEGFDILVNEEIKNYDISIIQGDTIVVR